MDQNTLLIKYHFSLKLVNVGRDSVWLSTFINLHFKG